MQILKALTLSAIFYTAGVSAAAVNNPLSARDANQAQACSADGEPCKGSVNCCASFYCASRGVSRVENIHYSLEANYCA